MNGYKTVNDLTADQLAELKQMMLIDTEDAHFVGPDSWYDSIGDFTDEAVKEYYATTYFVDDDFSCTAGGIAA